MSFQKDKHLILDEGLEPTVAVNTFAANANELLFIRATDVSEGLVTLAFIEPEDADDTKDIVLEAKTKSVAGCKDAIEDLAVRIASRRGAQVTVAGKDALLDDVLGFPIATYAVDTVTALVLVADGNDVVIPWATAPAVGTYYEAKIIGFDPAAAAGEKFDESTYVIQTGHITSALATNGLAFTANSLLTTFAVDDVMAVRVKIFTDSNPTGVTVENTGATENAGYTFTAS